MINAGEFKNVDFALMVHPGNENVLYAHYLARKIIQAEYFGRSAHASASPWDGLNALDAVVLGYQAVSVLRQQMKPNQRVHGIISNGGNVANIIPDYTSAEYFVRSPTSREMEDLSDRVVDCFKGAALAAKVEVKVTELNVYNDVNINETMVGVFGKYMEKLGKRFPAREVQESISRGSTDMGNVSYVVPGLFNLMIQQFILCLILA